MFGIKLEVIGVLMLGTALVFGFYSFHERQIGAALEQQKIVRASEHDGAMRAKKAAKAIVDAARPGAFARLQSDLLACPDCSGKPVPVMAPPNDHQGR